MSPHFIFLAAVGEVHYRWPTPGEAVYYFGGILLFLILNAVFVAAEFAFVKVRLSQIEAEGKDKSPSGVAARKIAQDINPYLSAAQLGITIASLALGALGEPFIEKLVGPVLQEISWFPRGLIPTVSWILAISSFTVLHVVVGEQLPKTIAIRKSLETTLLLARPMRFFYKLCSLPIRMLNDASNWLARVVFRIEPTNGHEEAHSAEELALLVTQSGKSQEVTETEREILINALGLNELWVRDVMTPRNKVIVLDADKPFDQTLDLALRSKHTRFPLVKGHLDNAIGLIHIKDLFKLINEPDPDLVRIKRELKMVPDTMPLDTLLKFFLREHAHLAMVVDEFGTPVGIVFLDNIMEELVGDIQDEFDNERSPFTRVNEDEFVVEGTMTLNDLGGSVAELVLDSGEVTTVGGYITQQIGRFPQVGETLEILGYEARVTSTDGRRVGQIHFRKLVPEVKDDEGDKTEN